jgi:hypothetical protein
MRRRLGGPWYWTGLFELEMDRSEKREFFHNEIFLKKVVDTLTLIECCGYEINGCSDGPPLGQDILKWFCLPPPS